MAEREDAASNILNPAEIARDQGNSPATAGHQHKKLHLPDSTKARYEAR